MRRKIGIIAGAAASALALVFVTVASAAGPTPAPLLQSGYATCTTDAGGYCTVNHTLGVQPEALLLTPRIDAGASSYTLNGVSGALGVTSFKVRAMDSKTAVHASLPITFWYMLTAVTSSPTTTTVPTSSTTTTTVAATTTTTVAPPAGGYPNTGNTGVADCNALPVHTGDYHTSANEVITGKHITGQLIVEDDNVQVKGSCIEGGITNYNSGTYHSFTVMDTDIGATSGCNGGEGIKFNSYTATRVRVHNFGDAFRATGNNVTIQDSYAKLCSNAGDHSDGFQAYQGGSGVHLIHNTIDQRDAAPDVTAPVFVADGSKGIELTNNLLAGGSFTIRIYGTTQSTVADNKIVDGSWLFGPVSSDCSNITWTNNKRVTINPDGSLTEVGDQVCVNG